MIAAAVELDCPKCGNRLRFNPNLAGTEVGCPGCGQRVAVPRRSRSSARTEARRRVSPAKPPPAAAKAPHRAPYTLWLLGAQAAVALLGLACLAGVFLRAGWDPPASSFFMENPLFLCGAGILLLLAGWFVGRLPVLATLGVAVFVLCASGHAYVMHDEVDASRAVALAVAMLALWFALQHRRRVG